MNEYLRLTFVVVSICGLRVAGAQSLPEQIRSCAAQPDTGARLECYDQMARRLGTTNVAPEPTAASAAAPAAAAEAAKSAAPASSAESEFGVAGSKLEPKKEAATPKEIRAVVTGVARRPRGELVITLENGQVWAQLTPLDYFPLKIGDSVSIARGALGSYILTIPAKRGAKVTRLL